MYHTVLLTVGTLYSKPLQTFSSCVTNSILTEQLLAFLLLQALASLILLRASMMLTTLDTS